MTDDIIKLLRDEVAQHEVRCLSLSPETVVMLLGQLDAAEAEIERLREDAERYRWLRGDSCPDHSRRWARWEVRHWRQPYWSDDLRGIDLDAAIDAAREAEK